MNAANRVLRRLRDRGEVEVITNHTPYVYAVKPSPIKRDSQKIPHYLEIASVFHQMAQLKKPELFVPEPKYGKGMPEPDIFALWGKPMFIEVQRNQFTPSVWADKFARYRTLYHRGDIVKEPWQKSDKAVFPLLIILTDYRIPVTDGLPFSVFQFRNISDLFTRKAV
nr:replication-relaxation family protein [Brevibacillus reuszeri]